MQLNTDYSERIVLHADEIVWTQSPMQGVMRKLLERNGAEAAKATSIVRYEPGSSFSLHTHDLGEEILVLDGVFEDETGHYGAGSYIKNPPGSSHQPGSSSGCTLFVKLRYMDPDDNERVVVQSNTASWYQGLVPGLTVLPLAEYATTHTALVRWAPNTIFKPHRHFGGEEIYVIKGVFEDEHGSYPAGSWIRSPHMSMHSPYTQAGCEIFVKTGHLVS